MFCDCAIMLIYANQHKTTQPISIFFTKRCVTGIQAKILSPKLCGVKMAEPKNKMLGTVETPLMQLSVNRSSAQTLFAILLSIDHSPKCKLKVSTYKNSPKKRHSMQIDTFHKISKTILAFRLTQRHHTVDPNRAIWPLHLG